MDSLPLFPNFSKLDITHSGIIRELAKNFPSYSDFNFVSLFTWDNEDKIEICSLHQNLIVKFSDYSTGAIFLSFLGTNEVEATIDRLLSYAKQHEIVPVLRLIGQSIIDTLSKNAHHKYDIIEDRDNHDYILSSSLLSDMANLHPNKRTKYNHFEREYGPKSHSTELDLGSPKVKEEIEDLMKTWQKLRSKGDSEVAREFAAIRRSLNHAKDLDVVGFGTYIDGQLCAFTLVEVLDDQTAMLHYGKSNVIMKGLSEAHQLRLAKFFLDKGIERLNNEQDLGIEGLRYSKMEGKPIDFLKKYTVALKDK